MQMSGTIPEDCTDFRPSFSNQGLCFTRNGAETDNMYKTTPYIKMFKKIMLPGPNNDTVMFNEGSGIQYQYSFLFDANRYMDLKRGEEWNKSIKTDLKLAIHEPNTVADIRGSGVHMRTGYKTTIRVNVMQLYSNQNIRQIENSKRGCNGWRQTKMSTGIEYHFLH